MTTTTTIEKVEIKNLKTCNGSDGGAFSCTLYINGKKVGEVRNGGNGGSNEYDFIPRDRDLARAFGEWLCAQPEAVKFREEYPESEEQKVRREQYGQPDWGIADIAFEEILRDFETAKWFKRQLKTVVLYRLPGKTYGKDEWLALPHHGKPEQLQIALVKKYGAGVVFGGI